jgi:ubiquinone/menaquinone biosynthesis C-methylase UbiE
MTSSYNRIAPFYDGLAKMIFGNTIMDSQKFLIAAIPPNSAVLIIGGGTGWILEEIAKIHSKGLKITYIELSEKMIKLSERKDFGENKVFFINQAIQDVVLNETFDVVITPFVIDNFSTATADVLFKKIDKSLVSDAIWLFADFQIGETNTLWKKAFLKLMYIFFKISCNIQATHLPDTSALFEKYGFEEVTSKTFFKDFMCSSVYRKKIGPLIS